MHKYPCSSAQRKHLLLTEQCNGRCHHICLWELGFPQILGSHTRAINAKDAGWNVYMGQRQCVPNSFRVPHQSASKAQPRARPGPCVRRYLENMTDSSSNHPSHSQSKKLPLLQHSDSIPGQLFLSDSGEWESKMHSKCLCSTPRKHPLASPEHAISA